MRFFSVKPAKNDDNWDGYGEVRKDEHGQHLCELFAIKKGVDKQQVIIIII